MAADLDSDVEQWGEYELWEKIEVRSRRRKRRIVAAAVVLFLILSAVPVVMERSPRWQTYRVARGLSQILSRVKTLAAKDAVAYRVLVGADLSLAVEKATQDSVHCGQAGGQAAAALWTPVDWSADVEIARWMERAREFGVVLLPLEVAHAQGLDRATDRFCYDPVVLASGPEPVTAQADGFGLLPRADLESARFDRLVVLGWHGPSAQVSLD